MILENQEGFLTQVSDKVARRVLVHEGSLMMVEFHFKKDGIGEPHKHQDHEQVGYVVKGSFELTLGGETRVIRKGDCYYAGKNVMHGVIALEDSIAVDVFTPVRQDYLP